jgi:hypothetical protein
MPKRKPVSRLHSKKPEDAKWRYQQAMVDADIEGLPRDPEAERLVAQMTAEGWPIERKIERIKAYYSAKIAAHEDVA